MSTRKRCLIVVFLLLPVPARADRHNWDMAISPLSTAKRSYLKGAHVGGALTVWPPPPPKCPVLPLPPCPAPCACPCPCLEPDGKVATQVKPPARKLTLALLADAGYHWGEHESANFTQLAVAGGLRLTYGRHRLEPFVHVLAGALQSHTTGIIDTNGLVGIGGGFDLVFLERFVARPQVDFFKVFSAGNDNTYPRISVGFVFRPEPRHHP